MKPDEAEFFKALRRYDGELPDVRGVIRAQGISTGKANYYIDRWYDQGLYDYGVSALDGWLTEAGEALARKMAGG